MGKLNDSFDTFLLGSDQMWNYYLSQNYKQSYYFDFAADEKIKLHTELLSGWIGL